MLDKQNSREVSKMAEEPVPEQRQRQDPEEQESQKALAGTDWVSRSEKDWFVKTPSICRQLFQVLLIDCPDPQHQDIWGACLSFAEVQI
jgi:hypothetical protein